MNIELKAFQEDASEHILAQLRSARREVAETGLNQAVSLSAVTGSGKTIIATDVIERVLEGYDNHPPDPEAAFLWLTDQPELNEQTRRKMLSSSTVLGSGQLITIDALSFDQETFRGGHVYFLNIQKLGRESKLVEEGDERNYTIWQTIENTINIKPASLYLIIDEAHRGMNETPRNRREAITIVQKFIKGSEGEISPVPLVLGITATPDRFRSLLEGTQRVARPVNVDVEAVRESGLIKDFVRFRVPMEATPSDITLLKNAVERWLLYCDQWQAYCLEQGIATVRPLLIVQVDDAIGGRITKTDLDEAVNAVEDIAGPMAAECYAHAFQEGAAVTLDGGRRIRYLAPSDINEDENVRVVFFKTSLSTGWDCPRAEVMMSFRRAIDATLIAQLVGRMVRTPLARRIIGNEMLNTVALMLPHYDAAGLRQVVERLRATDADSMPPVEFEPDGDLEELRRAVELADCFNVLEKIPTYVLPGRSRMSEVRRLMKLARLLVNSGIDADAIDKARQVVISVVDAEYHRVKVFSAFSDDVLQVSRIELQEYRHEFGLDLQRIPDDLWMEASPENVDDLFAEIGRSVGEGMHKIVWRHLVASGAEPDTAKREAIVLLRSPQLIERIVLAAKTAVSEDLQRHRAAFRALPESDRQEYAVILGTAKDPQLSQLEMPQVIEARKGDPKWFRHIFVNGENKFGAFPILNKWERLIIERELDDPAVIGWFRNPPRKRYALCVPYERQGKYAPLYPDFLVFRQTDDGVEVDILDPHDVGREDSPGKAAGLARFVDKHPDEFGRVILTIVEGDEIKDLDLMDADVRRRVRGVTSNQHLRDLYETL